jgi:aspartyl-tRNA(Asn)/glutamyl-tRNA(Gln) amidotransferase subunit B
MEEGSMRCDANISLRKKGDTKLGTKVEVKNLNSIRNVRKAIEIEAKRIESLLLKGETIVQETRGFDADRELTYSIRTKEDADDYRYFPDPDLTPFVITDAHIERYRDELPALPEEWVNRLITEFGLPEYDARVLTEDNELVNYFAAIADQCSNYKAVSNWLIGPVKSYCNENAFHIHDVNIDPGQWAKLIGMIDAGKLNFSSAASRLFPALASSNGADPEQLATELNMIQVSDSADLNTWVDEVLSKNPDKVIEFRKGKKGLIGLFMGEVKKLSKGKADPRLTNDILLQKLNQS